MLKEFALGFIPATGIALLFYFFPFLFLTFIFVCTIVGFTVTACYLGYLMQYLWEDYNAQRRGRSR